MYCYASNTICVNLYFHRLVVVRKSANRRQQTSYRRKLLTPHWRIVHYRLTGACQDLERRILNRHIDGGIREVQERCCSVCIHQGEYPEASSRALALERTGKIRSVVDLREWGNPAVSSRTLPARVRVSGIAQRRVGDSLLSADQSGDAFTACRESGESRVGAEECFHRNGAHAAHLCGINLERRRGY